MVSPKPRMSEVAPETGILAVQMQKSKIEVAARDKSPYPMLLVGDVTDC